MQLGPVLNERQPISKNMLSSSIARENIINAPLKNYSNASLGGGGRFSFIQTEVQKNALLFVNLLEFKFCGERDLSLSHYLLP